MKKVKGESDKEAILELVRHPAWLLLERKAKIILNNAQVGLIKGSKEHFDSKKGYYDGVKLFHDLITERPLEIINIDGFAIHTKVN